VSAFAAPILSGGLYYLFARRTRDAGG